MRTALLAAAVLAAAFLFLLLPLPSRPVVLSPPSSQILTAAGSLHIHTNRSDGSGSSDEVAAAAARAGLNFIVLTDHGDATRTPDPPQYRSGVLVIDAVELSTDGGHYIAIGLPQAPYPLRGEARDVVDDVRRLGGFGIVAHPHSVKPSLRWTDWNAPFDAMEWLNADSEWRDEGSAQLARALIRYPFRPAETLASLLDRPDATLARWDMLTQQRQVVAVAGADAHARAGWMDDDANGYRGGWFLKMPSYETSFRTFSTRLILNHALRGNADADAAEVLSALKAGRVYSAIDALAAPPRLEFRSRAGEFVRSTGELGPGGIFVASSSVTTGGVVVLRKDGRIVAQQPLPEVTFDSKGEEGTYRAEVYLSSAPGDPPVPWIVSNPIYIRPSGWGTPLPVAVETPTITRG
ncbi:MAG TPA: CehA/McbA family metallohydrolase, partial [Vicinamibacterales bacterium]